MYYAVEIIDGAINFTNPSLMKNTITRLELPAIATNSPLSDDISLTVYDLHNRPIVEQQPGDGTNVNSDEAILLRNAIYVVCIVSGSINIYGPFVVINQVSGWIIRDQFDNPHSEYITGRLYNPFRAPIFPTTPE